MVSISGSKGTIWATGSVTVGSGVDGSVVMDGTTATVSGLGNTTTAYDGFANGKGKAATEEQLKEISEVAENANQGWNLSTNGGEASKVAPGETVDFSGDQNINISNDGTNVKVELKNDIYLAGDDPNAFVNISGSKGTIWASGSVTAGSVAAGDVFMDGATATVSGLSNQTTAYDGFANGKGKAATEEQLKEVATEAGKHTTVTDGANITVTEGLNKDGGKEYKVALNNDILLSGDNDAFVNISGSKGSVWASSSVAAGNVVMDGASATVSGLSNQTTAYDGFANGKGKAATEEQLKEISKVADNANQGWNLSTNGDAASKVAPGETVDFSGDKNISVSNNGKDVKVELNKDLDVNSVQTNALNAKYNLSVGTANENGTVPFFVNSNGAFYAANGKLVVDKDGKLVAPEAELGKVTADEGVIGNVVLKDGVFYKNSALRDGELFVGDASGNYSQITTKGAKLGKVTVAADGKISGVAAGAVTADSTDAVNGSQLHAVATEAGKHSKVVSGNNINVEETDVDGQKFYKVNMNKDIMLGDLTGKNVSISGTNGTIETTGYIATKDRVYADKGAKLADIDVTGNKISNGASSIVLDGSNVKVNDKVTIDQNGNIAGVNSLQTNALNAKYNLSVGTANENGIMPFFVNSTGDFYAAHNKFSVDKDGKVTATAGEIGNVVLNNGVFYKNSALRDGELFIGDADGNYSQITPKSAKLGKVTIDKDGKISGVAAGAVTADSTDAVNGSQLHAVATEASKHSKVVGGNNINVEETDVDGQKFYKVNMNKDIILGDLTGKYVNISGTNGTIETTGYIATQDRVYADKGAKLADIDVTGNKISNGASSIVLDGSNVKVNDKVTIDQDGKISGVAAGEVSSTSTDAINGSQLHQTNVKVNELDNRVTKNEEAIKKNADDIATNKANIEKNAADIAQNKTDIKNLDNRVTNVEELAKKHTTVTAGDNITVTEDKNKDGGKEYKVALDKDIKLDSVTTGQTVMNNDGLKVGKDVSVTATAVTAGKTSISDEGVKVGDKTYISDKGLNANGQQITNVADGKENSDAVNYGQLKGVENQVISNTNRINKLGSRVNKVGAGAAALAALHPMDFDPDDKLTFSAGYGNYAGENAAAIGAYYRPDEKVMFSVAGTVGNGENMVNAGVSFALDRTNHVSNSRTALAREVIDLRGQLAVMGAKMAKMEKAFGMLDETKTKLFPDVPANHWAYEYIAKLAGNGYIEGYPDGNFGGDRLMTRYEFAAMLYRAIENGAALEEKIIKEFEPELGRIRVDRISGEDGDRDKIERVRVNDTKGERDHYGNKLAK